MTDTLTVRLVVISIAALAGIFGCGLIWLIAIGTPAASVGLVAGPLGVLVGALAALLASTRSSSSSGDDIGGATVSAQINDVPVGDIHG